MRQTVVSRGLAAFLAALTVVPLALFFGGWFPPEDPTMPLVALLVSPLGAGVLAGIAVGRALPARRWIRYSVGLVVAFAVWFVISSAAWAVVLSGMD
jgi:hypothetical protein